MLKNRVRVRYSFPTNRTVSSSARTVRHEPVHAATAGAVHPNAVLPLGHVARRLDRPVAVRILVPDRVVVRSLVEDDADRSLPLAPRGSDMGLD
jgi:hypothetical protein